MFALPAPPDDTTRWPRVLSCPPRVPLVARLDGEVAWVVHDDRPTMAPGPFDEQWLRAHAMEWDIAHMVLGHGMVHPDGDLLAAVRMLRLQREQGAATVVTVLDGMDEHAQELVQRARPWISQLVVCSAVQAELLAEAVGVHATVVPHVPVLSGRERELARRRRRRHQGIAHGRPVVLAPLFGPDRTVPAAVMEAVVEAVEQAPGRPALRLLVAPGRVPEDLQRQERVEVVQVDPDDVPALVDQLVAVDRVVLLARGSSHAALVELVADVGVPLVTTPWAHTVAHHPTRVVPWNDDGPDPAVLARELARPSRGPVVGADCERERQEHAFGAGIARVYDRARLGATLLAAHELVLPDATPTLTTD